MNELKMNENTHAYKNYIEGRRIQFKTIEKIAKSKNELPSKLLRKNQEVLFGSEILKSDDVDMKFLNKHPGFTSRMKTKKEGIAFLRKMREIKGLTFAELSKKTGIKQIRISNIFYEISGNIERSELESILIALGVRMSSVEGCFDLFEDMKPERIETQSKEVKNETKKEVFTMNGTKKENIGFYTNSSRLCIINELEDTMKVLFSDLHEDIVLGSHQNIFLNKDFKEAIGDSSKMVFVKEENLYVIEQIEKGEIKVSITHYSQV